MGKGENMESQAVLVRGIMIGHEYSDEFVPTGASEVACVSAADRTKLAQFFRCHGGEARYLLVDVVDPREIHDMMERGQRLLDNDRKAEERRVAAEEKRRAAAEKARKLKRLAKLEQRAREAAEK